MFFSEKCAFGGYKLTSRSPSLLNRFLPVFFLLTRKKSLSKKQVTDFEYLYPFRRYSPPNFEVDRNRAKFCMFLTFKIFLEKLT